MLVSCTSPLPGSLDPSGLIADASVLVSCTLSLCCDPWGLPDSLVNLPLSSLPRPLGGCFGIMSEKAMGQTALSYCCARYSKVKEGLGLEEVKDSQTN